MAASFFRRDELLNPVAEEKRPDLVVVYYGRETQDSGDLRDQIPLRPLTRSEKAGTADVDQKDDRLSLSSSKTLT